LESIPTLYKKTSTGTTQFWKISVEDNVITTEYGLVGTESPQKTRDTIQTGKNEGRSNETTPQQQATFEAEAKYKKQLKKGYVLTIDAAQAGEVDDIIEGGILPMLAHKYADHAKKIKFPCFGQPKLDGIRCSAIKKNGKCTLWTRTRQPIYSMPHIIAAVEEMFPGDISLDGELYNHEYRDNFEDIVSLVRPDEPVEGHEVVQFHIYDTPTTAKFRDRNAWMIDNIKGSEVLIRVESYSIPDEAAVIPFHDKMAEQGYEGAMLRNADSLYVNKRSYDLQKVKVFDTDEFEVFGFEEGRGRLSGCVGSFWCRMKDGNEFKAKQRGSQKRLREYFLHHEMWQGKQLSVKYQGFTAYGKPRFPVGIAIRDYE
jgi:DNA ligase-1